MGPKEIAEHVAEKQGWSLVTLFDVVCGYIENQRDDEAFDEYLEDIAARENQMRAEQGS